MKSATLLALPPASLHCLQNFPLLPIAKRCTTEPFSAHFEVKFVVLRTEREKKRAKIERKI